MDLTKEQQWGYELAEQGKSLFFTGGAGTGKTALGQYIVDELIAAGRNVDVTASTGLAAVNMGGVTLHSWLGTGRCGSLAELESYRRTEEGRSMLAAAAKRHRDTDTLVIDECSMISADMLDMAVKVINQHRQKKSLQFIFIGDFCQLPPVIKGVPHSEKKFAFESEAWSGINPVIVNLTKVFRQHEKKFFAALNGIRLGRFEERFVRVFDSCVVDDSDSVPAEVLRLYSTKAQVESHNRKMLDGLLASQPEVSFKATLFPSLQPAEWSRRYESDFLPEPVETIKKGAPVIFTANLDVDGGIVNGTGATVIDVNQESIRLRINDGPSKGTVHCIDPNADRWTWEKLDAKGKVVASISQVPIKLAFALTVHKSQGMGLERIHVTLERNFEVGQVYVALSRARSLKGLTIDRPLKPSDVRVADVCRRSYEVLDKKPKAA